MNSMQRVLRIKQSLKQGEKISIDALCVEFNKHRETIKRDIRFIRNSLEDEGIQLIYDHHTKLYEIQKAQQPLTIAQLYTIFSILHGSRTLHKEDLQQLENSLIELLSKDERVSIRRLISSYQFHYRASTNDPLLYTIEMILESILKQVALDIVYVTARSEEKQMRITPYTIVFDEGYFYVVTHLLNQSDDNLYNLRIDRIICSAWTMQKFTVNQNGNDYFKPGQYANMSIKMYSGDRAQKIKLKVQSHVVSYFEDQFPEHQFIEKTSNWSIYEIKVLNDEGALFWILSERNWVEVLEPIELREKLKAIIAEMAKLYE